jgi:dynein heavy chain
MVHIVRGELDLLKRTLMGALMVLDVHARDVVGLLQKANVQSCNDFDWQKQLRYEWNVEIDDCYAR